MRKYYLMRKCNLMWNLKRPSLENNGEGLNLLHYFLQITFFSYNP